VASDTPIRAALRENEKQQPAIWPTTLHNIKSFLLLAFDVSGGTPRRTVIQRLAIPHTFQEGLAFPQGAIAIAEAFLRILLGSLLFAFWGTFVWWTWSAIQNNFLRCLVAAFLAAIFLWLVFALMIAISFAARAVMPKRT